MGHQVTESLCFACGFWILARTHPFFIQFYFWRVYLTSSLRKFNSQIQHYFSKRQSRGFHLAILFFLVFEIWVFYLAIGPFFPFSCLILFCHWVQSRYTQQTTSFALQSSFQEFVFLRLQSQQIGLLFRSDGKVNSRAYLCTLACSHSHQNYLHPIY